jgi:hypothetical protein
MLVLEFRPGGPRIFVAAQASEIGGVGCRARLLRVFLRRPPTECRGEAAMLAATEFPISE